MVEGLRKGIVRKGTALGNLTSNAVSQCAPWVHLAELRHAQLGANEGKETALPLQRGLATAQVRIGQPCPENGSFNSLPSCNLSHFVKEKK